MVTTIGFLSPVNDEMTVLELLLFQLVVTHKLTSIQTELPVNSGVIEIEIVRPMSGLVRNLTEKVNRESYTKLIGTGLLLYI